MAIHTFFFSRKNKYYLFFFILFPVKSSPVSNNINMGNKGKNKVDNGVVLKEDNPNRPTSKPINKEA